MFSIKTSLLKAQKYLSFNSEILNPRLEADLILAMILKKNINHLYTYPNKTLNIFIYLYYRYLLFKRYHLYPLDYILSYKNFYNIKLKMKEDVFIPRPETEILVDKVLEYVNKADTKQNILEIGVGSGAIMIAILKNTQNIKKYYYNDIYYKALALTKKNIVLNFLENNETIIELKEKCIVDLVKYLQKIDILISNPPYVPYDKYKKSKTIKYENRKAITDFKDGNEFFRNLFLILYKYQIRINFIILEIDENNLDNLQNIFYSFNLDKLYKFSSFKDLQNLDRFIILDGK